MKKWVHIDRQEYLIDWKFSNEIMLRALGALEKLIFLYGFKGPHIFEYYYGYAEDENDIITSVVTQLEIFRASYSNYVAKYSNYDFPNNLSRDQIINIVLEWKKFIHPSRKQNEIFFDEILKYLGGDSKYSGISDKIEQKKKEHGPTTKKDLERMANIIPSVNRNMHNQINEIKETYNKKGDFEINAKIKQKREDNKNMENLNKNDKEYQQREINFRKVEEQIESFLGKLDEKYIEKKFSDEDAKILIELVNLFESSIKRISLDKKEIIPKIKGYGNVRDKI